MALTLKIENETTLPDGGPLSITVTGQRGIDIGRDQYLDWTLPDPTRCISGKHCEVRYLDGGYWLYDVSTNGTFVNSGDRRVQSPYRLRNGDRLDIGHYVISVAVDGEAAGSSPAAPGRAIRSEELWTAQGDVAPPMAMQDFRPPKPAEHAGGDPESWFVDLPQVFADPPRAAPPAPPPLPPAFTEDSWAEGGLPPAPAPEPAPIPMPTRPRAPVADPGNPWGTPTASPVQERPRTSDAFRPEPPPVGPALPPEQPSLYSPAGGGGASGSEFVRRFAKGLGVPEETLAWQDPGEFAEQLGVLTRLVADNMKQLLSARAETKRLVRSHNQTMIQALDNNPLKFAPTPQDALRIMFGPPTSGYLTASRAFEQSFKDVKTHQIKTYAAMQHALRLLLEDIDPEAIEAATESEGGLAALLSSRKAKLWDLYVARWKAKAAHHDDGLLDAFMLYFAECYEGGGGRGR